MHKQHKAPKLHTAVGVDLGGLIRKVLARYPGEFTLFRELLQNSDDAHSKTVEIYFETANSKPPNIVQWIFKNDGDEFTPEDWARLTKIAKGNTNPTKVGAFGVGFYSLFSVTDHPVVLSGREGKEFYWTDDMEQLCVRRVNIPSKGTTSPWTIFNIPLREPSPMPGAVEFLRFLATSITFMVHLKSVEVFLDGRPIGHISKFPLGPATVVDFPIEFKQSSPMGMMVVNNLQCHKYAIQAETLSEIRGLPDMCSVPLSTGNSPHSYPAKGKLDLTVFTAEVNVEVSEKLSNELLRCTSKRPPRQLKYHLVYTGKDQYDRSFVDQQSKPLISVFQGLRADLNGALDPRIFIGHSTSQTTGIGGHMASSFIPTVERESMDLVDGSVSIWNMELLYVGGFLARAVYESELSAIQTLWKEATRSDKPEFEDRLRDLFAHVLKFFTFYESTPSSKVAQVLQQSFYSCSPSPLRLLSSLGVCHASDVRSFDFLCSKFLKSVPMLSPEITKVAQRIINALPSEHKILDITLSDVLRDLPERTLDKGELAAYLEWIFHRSTADRAKLLEIASFSHACGARIKLSTIRSFIDSNGLGAYIPQDGPMPLSLIPLEITKSFASVQLVRLGWQEFTIADWLRHISQAEVRLANPEHDFLRSVDWAECVLHTVSFAWSSSDEIRSLAKSIFTNRKCIPIMHELYNPEETYLPSWDIPVSDDLGLQVVQIPPRLIISGEMKRLLVALGVQQHIAPRHLLRQMIETGKWETSVLIDYLVQVADTLNPAEIAELKSYDAFAGVGGQNGTKKTRFRADELYPPIPIFQQFHLRVIEWRGSEWRDTTPEAELMYRLGLRRHPPLEHIVKLCSQGTTIGENAFRYLCTNLRSVYSGYNPDNFRHIAFIPATNVNGPRLEKLGDVFLDDQWKTLGLSVIRHKYLENVLDVLGVRRHPPSSLLLQLLKTKPPPNEEIARQWFEILSNHVSCFGQDELDILSQLPMVPKRTSGEGRKWLTPGQCYLGKSTKHNLYSKLFDFVNFGTGAIQFLRACGAKNEPSEEDVAEFLIDNHDEFYKLSGHERFLQELHDLAVRHTRIPSNTISKLKLKPVLLGVQRKKTADQDRWKNIHSLWEPREIVIVNDIHTYQLFGDLVIAAPQNMSPELEDFYVLLGCAHLTNVVRAECNPSGEEENTTMCSKFRALIKQRLLLFLRHYQHRPRTCFSGAITVRVCERLSVSKILTVKNRKSVKERNVWATAEDDEQGIIHIWISRNAKQDMYELSTSLCRVLLHAVYLNDALLLTSILSEDLDVLRGRGYEVEQVLRSPEYLNDPVVSGATKLRSSITPETSLPFIDPTTRPPVADASIDSMPVTTIHSPDAESSKTALGGSSTSSSEMSLTLTNVTNNFCEVFRAVSRSIMPSTGIEPSGTTSVTILPPTPWDLRQVMPQSFIQSTVRESIQACNPGSLCHRRDADMIKFLNDGYCNVSVPIDKLRYLGSMENVDIYVSQGTSNVDTFMERMQEQLTHFVRIIARIAETYGLPMGSLRIFYDTTARCIAFNHQGTLYLNLLYFETWHYQDVKNGNSRRALSSWFLTLAHEIAHNLVEHHDSEHEFWFSAICEAHMDAFSQLLGPSSISG